MDSVPSDQPEVDLDSRPRQAEGLYIHIPFCVALCPYCDFVVYAGAAARGPRNRFDALVTALQREVVLRAAAVQARRPACHTRTPLSSVYFGGGTPSLLHPAQVQGLLESVELGFGMAPGAEVTLEANPGPDEIEDLVGMVEAGVTRLSIGAQSMDRDELKRLGRRHAPDDVASAVSRARAAGFGSIGLDLLTDIPGQSLDTWRRTLSAVLALGPDHLSVYALSLDDPDAEGLTGPGGGHLPVSRGARRWRERARDEQSDDRAADMDEITDELTTAAGLERYEIANFAAAGHRSQHNLLYWRRRPHLGIGPGAHAFDGHLVRSWNAARLDDYVDALADDQLPPGGTERLEAPAAISERAMLGLRLSDGIDAKLAAQPDVSPALDWARSIGLAETTAQGRVRLTARGRSLSNEVFVRLLPDPPDGAATRAPARQARAT